MTPQPAQPTPTLSAAVSDYLFTASDKPLRSRFQSYSSNLTAPELTAPPHHSTGPLLTLAAIEVHS
jgi:hypothetical protein